MQIKARRIDHCNFKVTISLGNYQETSYLDENEFVDLMGNISYEALLEVSSKKSRIQILTELIQECGINKDELFPTEAEEE